MPFPLIPVIIGLIAAGSATKAYGQVKAGNAARSAGDAAAEREQFNASIADLQAEDALARGADEESQLRVVIRSTIGRQRAGYAAQNIDVNAGTALEVQADAAYLGELDAQRIRANAAREAWGLTVEAEDRRLAAQYSRMSGQAAQSASRWGAVSTGIEGGASLLLTKYGFERARTTPTPRVPGR